MANKVLDLGFDMKRILSGKIIKYFSEERGEVLGELGAELLLDFITENFGKEFYNKGIQDARKYLTSRMEEVEEGLEYLYV